MPEERRGDQANAATNGTKPGKPPKKVAKKKSTSASTKAPRPNSDFPQLPIQESLELADAIQEHAAGEEIRRLTLFEKLDRSPESSTSRTMITSSNRYKLTQGGYQSETLKLSENGNKATSPESSELEKKKALFNLAIESIPPFKHLYDRLKDKRLPSPEVMRDWLSEVNIDERQRKACVDVFIENARHLGLLRTIAGAERLISLEQAIEELPRKPSGAGASQTGDSKVIGAKDLTKTDWKQVCFFIAPIGMEGEEERKHSDMVLETLITRALEGEGFNVVRADRITDPGMISAQVLEYIARSGLVIADLSFHNPNVFYELGIRHMTGKPTIHIIRQCDAIPFDLKDFRTIVIDTDDKYSLIAKLETYRSEISTHVRRAVSAGDSDSNPVRSSIKGITVTIE